MSNQLNKDQLDRLWDHGLHEDNIFSSRLNFFLVFESVLLGVVAMLFERPAVNMGLVKVMIVFGITITLLWGYIQMKHRHSLEVLKARVAEADPDYRVTVARRNQKWYMKLSITWLLAYAVPAVVLGIWIVLLFI